jgi:hypothetical protein
VNQLHIVLNLLLRELLNSFPPFFHLGFLSPKAWFCTLNKVLSNNYFKSFNLLFIITNKMGLGLFSCSLVVSYWPLPVLDLISKTFFFFFKFIKFYVGNYMLSFKILTGMFQIVYDTLLFQIELLRFGIVSRHLFQISFEMSQFIMGPLIEFNILLLQVFNFPSNLFYLIQLIRQVLVFMLDLIQLSFDCDQFFVNFSKVFALFLTLGYRFASGYGSQTTFPWLVQTIRFESFYNVLDDVVAFWATCSKNMLIYLIVYVEWQKMWTCWNLKKLWVLYLYRFNYKLNKLEWFCTYSYKIYNGNYRFNRHNRFNLDVVDYLI